MNASQVNDCFSARIIYWEAEVMLRYPGSKTECNFAFVHRWLLSKDGGGRTEVILYSVVHEIGKLHYSVLAL